MTANKEIYSYVFVFWILCWKVMNASYSYSVLDSGFCLISFKAWIFQLNISFLFCDGVCSNPPNALLMSLFNSFSSGKYWQNFDLKFQTSSSRHHSSRRVLCTCKLLSKCRSSFLAFIFYTTRKNGL